MYVCVCKAVSDKRIEREVRQGVISLRDLSQATGLGTCCGKCVHDARRHLADAVARQMAREHLHLPLGAVAV
jgi:bacterioferritin-associated ferredoxin